MPLRSTPKPAVMTWPKATLYIVIAVFFDVIRFLCEALFWLIGPLLIQYYVSQELLWGGTVSNIAGTAAGAAGAYFAEPAIIFVGMMLGMLFGFIGWLLIAFLFLFFNRRIFSENTANFLWFLAGFALSEVPLVGALPALTATTFKMLHAQIKKEKAALQQWEKDQARLAEEQRQSRTIAAMRSQAILAAQAQQSFDVAEQQAEEVVSDQEDLAEEEDDFGASQDAAFQKA